MAKRNAKPEPEPTGPLKGFVMVVGNPLGGICQTVFSPLEDKQAAEEYALNHAGHPDGVLISEAQPVTLPEPQEEEPETTQAEF